jgi:hypothetical protein
VYGPASDRDHLVGALLALVTDAGSDNPDDHMSARQSRMPNARKEEAIATPSAGKARRRIPRALAHGEPSPPIVLPCMNAGACMEAGASIAAADDSPMLRSLRPSVVPGLGLRAVHGPMQLEVRPSPTQSRAVRRVGANAIPC